MNKSKVISIMCGLGIIITTIIMIFNLKNVAYEHSMHPEWSLGVSNAVQIVAIIYSVVICIFTIILVLTHLLNKSNK